VFWVLQCCWADWNCCRCWFCSAHISGAN